MSATTESLVTRLRQGRVTRRDQEQQPGRAATWDLLKVAVLVPAITTLVLLVVVTLTKLLAGGVVGGLGAQVGAAWLAVNQVPLTVGGVTVGVLQLLPTLAMIAGTAVVTARASREVDTLAEVGSIAGAALAGPLLWTALALAIVADGAAVSSIGQAPPLPAFGYTLLVQGLGVAVGVGRRCLQPIFDSYEFPVTDRVGARAGLLAFLGMVAGGAVLVVIGVVTKWGRIGELIAEGHSFDGYLGLTFLSILYLPNIVIDAAALAIGAQVSGGTAPGCTVIASTVAVPPLPILGAIPEQGLGGIGALVFVIPVLVGALVGWYCRSHDLIKHLRAVGIAAAVCAALMVLAAGLSGGGAGEIGRVGVSAPLAGVYAFGWVALGGGLAIAVHRFAPAAWVGRTPASSFGASDSVDFDLDELLASDEFADLEIVDDPDAEFDDFADDQFDDQLGDEASDDACDELDDESEGEVEPEADGDLPADNEVTDVLDVIEPER